MTNSLPATADEWHNAVLVLPRLRVQNANAISSPMTWGFPAMTAFVGFMAALERRLGADAGIRFSGIGVVSHGFDPQVTTAGYTRSFSLTRNPVQANGRTASIVEEGRVHLDVTLVLQAEITAPNRDPAALRALAQRVADSVAGMRCAGGSVMPPVSGARPPRPMLALEPDDPDESAKQFRRLSRRWLPGFALVARDDLLRDRLASLRITSPQATALDAWLDLSRWTRHASRRTKIGANGPVETVEWAVDPRQGWTVPIPVGYAALSDLYPPGAVARARSASTPFRFVESVYSIGQWVSPHRLRSLGDLVWYANFDEKTQLYRCLNDYAPPAVQPPAEPATV